MQDALFQELLVEDIVHRNHDVGLERVGPLEAVAGIQEQGILFQRRNIGTNVRHGDHEGRILNENADAGVMVSGHGSPIRRWAPPVGPACHAGPAQGSGGGSARVATSALIRSRVMAVSHCTSETSIRSTEWHWPSARVGILSLLLRSWSRRLDSTTSRCRSDLGNELHVMPQRRQARNPASLLNAASIRMRRAGAMMLLFPSSPARAEGLKNLDESSRIPGVRDLFDEERSLS